MVYSTKEGGYKQLTCWVLVAPVWPPVRRRDRKAEDVLVLQLGATLLKQNLYKLMIINNTIEF